MYPITLDVIFIRFAVVFTLAFIFGLERQLSHKPVGFGAFIFVAIGACGLGIAAVTFSPDNPLSIMGAIVTGIGFLGAGALIKTSDKIFGATTAASIWAFAIFGMMIGIGYFAVGLIIYALMWIIIIFDRFMERKGVGMYQRKIFLNTNRIVDKKEVLSIFLGRRWKLVNLNIDVKQNKSSILYIFEGEKEDIAKIQELLCKKKWIDSFKIE